MNLHRSAGHGVAVASLALIDPVPFGAHLGLKREADVVEYAKHYDMLMHSVFRLVDREGAFLSAVQAGDLTTREALVFALREAVPSDSTCDEIVRIVGAPARSFFLFFGILATGLGFGEPDYPRRSRGVDAISIQTILASRAACPVESHFSLSLYALRPGSVNIWTRRWTGMRS